MAKVLVNGKYMMQHTTGVQRYARGIVPNLNKVEIIAPTAKNTFTQTFWEQNELPKLAKKNKQLLLNFCNTAPAFYKNQIVTIHDMAVFENPNWFAPAFAKYYQWLFRQHAKNALHFVTVSEFSKLEMMRHLRLKESQISVIHSAPNRALKELTSTKQNLEIDQPFLLMVGSHDPRKNFEFVINTLNPWLSRNNFKLIIVGKPGKAFAKMETTKSEHVVWLQNTSDEELKWLYEHCQALIHPALYEGFSLVPVEAIMLGAKTLVSEIPVHREILGDATEFFDLDSETDFIEKLEFILTQTKLEYGLNYNFTSSANKWRDLIREFN